MDSAKMGKWRKFFREAGINEASAASYAAMFVRHDINEELIIELTRQILREMGITIMGHTLAILKHAKVVHEKLEEEASKSTSCLTPNSQKMETAQTSNMVVKPALKHPESQHFATAVATEKKLKTSFDLPAICSPPQHSPAVKRVNKKLISPRVPSVSKASATKLKVTDRLGMLKNSYVPDIVSVKTKQIMSRTFNESDDVPAKRICKILPEEERYKITINSTGTSRKSQLQGNQTSIIVNPHQAKTVFGRLSDVSVSSTTEQDVLKKASGSVFSRLGKKGNEIVGTQRQHIPVPALKSLMSESFPSTSFTRTISQFSSVEPLVSKNLRGVPPVDQSARERQTSVKFRLGNLSGPPTITKWLTTNKVSTHPYAVPNTQRKRGNYLRK